MTMYELDASPFGHGHDMTMDMTMYVRIAFWAWT